ncbi:MAG TPA: MarR family transcriptional regulator [Caulobacteraceae bacterium]|nr:MarR family transcriptional regulator [Caulobacteraceae bacterium]
MATNPERYHGLADIRYALRRFIAASEVINRAAGVTQQQYQAMLAIKTGPSEAMAVMELAELLLLTHHGTVQLVDRLAKAGLVERSPSPQDRRSVLLKLTPKGETLLDGLADRHLEEMLRHEPLLSRSLRRLKHLAPGA